ncbi:Rubisco large subunit N-methyltransferase [Dunaliella salina]|uniref:Rubisco large subunit N-methyltransferase n=1 Tax=Dunaliella salina TaxID=3046 RepID=A0ABQ7GF20_DUNSA|nr:Rubisco large subunit N-methyltransferase [Dunaliella salina]|eukprot:KAF5833208.1 Rubisco large subunit N-methyltransferase [Dunaliella salina]
MQCLQQRSGSSPALHAPSQRSVSSCNRRFQRRAFRAHATAGAAAAPTDAALRVSPQQLSILQQHLGSQKSSQVDKVAVDSNLDTGSAILVAAKDVGAGEALLALPDSQWLTPQAASKSAIGPYVQDLEPWVQVALLLIHERFVSSSPAWAPYVSSLPATPTSPLFWSEENLGMLQGTQLMENLQAYRAFFQAKYEELLGTEGLLSNQAPSAFPPQAFTYDNFEWAVATVRARAHPPLEGGSLALVPLADAVSHRRRPNAEWKLKPAGLFGRAKQLVVEATKPVRKGEEVSIDYAPSKLDNSVLLDYGVLDTTAPQPGYALKLSLPAGDRNLDDKLDIVELRGMGPTQTHVLTPGGAPSEAMMGFLRLIQLQGQDAFLLEPIFRQEVWDFMCEPVSEDNERAVCESMAEGARETLQGYSTSIDQDLALLRSGELQSGSPEQAAVMVRLGEQEALDDTLQWFENRMQTELKKLVYYQERRLRALGLVDDEGRTTYDSFFEDGIA